MNFRERSQVEILVNGSTHPIFKLIIGPHLEARGEDELGKKFEYSHSREEGISKWTLITGFGPAPHLYIILFVRFMIDCSFTPTNAGSSVGTVRGFSAK